MNKAYVAANLLSTTSHINCAVFELDEIIFGLRVPYIHDKTYDVFCNRNCCCMLRKMTYYLIDKLLSIRR